MARFQTDDRAENPQPAEWILALGGCWVLLGTIAYYWLVAI